RLLGLAYADPVSGSNVLIAQLQSSIGQLVSDTRVVYPAALGGDCEADILLENSKAGLEQNIIIRTRPPPPTEYGLSADSMLQIWTEFVTSPEPGFAPNSSESDAHLDFGAMKIGPGTAFLVGSGSNAPPTRVLKHWVVIGGKKYLVEEVPLLAAAAALLSLPSSSGGTNHSGGAMIPDQTPRTLFARGAHASPGAATSENPPALSYL